MKALASDEPVAWDVYFTAAAEDWILGLDDEDYEAIMAAIELLEENGPTLGRPAVDRIKGSRDHNNDHAPTSRRTDLMATRPIDEIRKRRPLTPEGRAHVDQIKRAMQLEIALAELREMRGVTQSSVADTLGTSRPNVARIEKELDIRLSTLERYVQALGGKLEIHAVFDDQDVTLTA